MVEDFILSDDDVDIVELWGMPTQMKMLLAFSVRACSQRVAVATENKNGFIVTNAFCGPTSLVPM